MQCDFNLGSLFPGENNSNNKSTIFSHRSSNQLRTHCRPAICAHAKLNGELKCFIAGNCSCGRKIGMVSDCRNHEQWQHFKVVLTDQVAQEDMVNYAVENHYEVAPTVTDVPLDELTIGEGRFGAATVLKYPGCLAADYPFVIMETTCKLTAADDWLTQLESIPLFFLGRLQTIKIFHGIMQNGTHCFPKCCWSFSCTTSKKQKIFTWKFKNGGSTTAKKLACP